MWVATLAGANQRQQLLPQWRVMLPDVPGHLQTKAVAALHDRMPQNCECLRPW